MRITFIDAGQADASVTQIEQPSGEPFTIVVDGGDGRSDIEDNLPGLLVNDPTVELIVLTHPHKDHTLGLDWLVNSSTIPIGQVWFSDEEQVSLDQYVDFLAGVANRGIPISRPAESVHQFPGFTGFDLRVFNNGRESPGASGEDGNNDSVVFQVRYRPAPSLTVTALFTGDIEGEQDELLVQQFGSELRSDIVKVPHHGSGELFPGFPAAVAARFAFVSSSGTNLTFRHPRKSALDLYDATAQIFCTCDAARRKRDFTLTVNNAGNISVTPVQPPYFVWVTTAGGLRRRTVTP